MRAMRIAVVFAFILTIPIAYSIARCLFGREKSVALCIIWIVWALPQYIASMPSWYNVFLNFAAIGLFTIYLREHARWPLVLAGIVTALSISIKVIGLYLLIASLLFLLYESQTPLLDRNRAKMSPFSWLVAAAGTLVVTGAAFVLRRHLNLDYIVFFILPLIAPWVVVVARERRIDLPFMSRAHAVFWLRGAPYLLGIATVCAGWLIRYPTFSDLVKVWNGIFIIPHRRADAVTFGLPPLPLPVYPIFLIIVVLALRRKRADWIEVAALSIITALAVFWAGSAPPTESGFDILSATTYRILLSATPCILLGSFALLMNKPDGALGFLIASVGSYFLLVMYPFSAAIYFAYSFSFVLFAGAVMLEERQYFSRAAGWILGSGSLIVGILCFGLIQMRAIGNASELLDTPRGLVRFSPKQASALRTIITLVAEKVPAGQRIYAGPDAPEVLFLTGRQHIGGFVIESIEDFDASQLREQLRLADLDFAIVKHGVDERFAGRVHKAVEPTLRELLPREENLGPYSILSRDR